MAQQQQETLAASVLLIDALLFNKTQIKDFLNRTAVTWAQRTSQTSIRGVDMIYLRHYQASHKPYFSTSHTDERINVLEKVTQAEIAAFKADIPGLVAAGVNVQGFSVLHSKSWVSYDTYFTELFITRGTDCISIKFPQTCMQKWMRDANRYDIVTSRLRLVELYKGVRCPQDVNLFNPPKGTKPPSLALVIPVGVDWSNNDNVQFMNDCIQEAVDVYVAANVAVASSVDFVEPAKGWAGRINSWTLTKRRHLKGIISPYVGIPIDKMSTFLDRTDFGVIGKTSYSNVFGRYRFDLPGLRLVNNSAHKYNTFVTTCNMDNSDPSSGGTMAIGPEYGLMEQGKVVEQGYSFFNCFTFYVTAQQYENIEKYRLDRGFARYRGLLASSASSQAPLGDDQKPLLGQGQGQGRGSGVAKPLPPFSQRQLSGSGVNIGAKGVAKGPADAIDNVYGYTMLPGDAVKVQNIAKPLVDLYYVYRGQEAKGRSTILAKQELEKLDKGDPDVFAYAQYELQNIAQPMNVNTNPGPIQVNGVTEVVDPAGIYKGLVLDHVYRGAVPYNPNKKTILVTYSPTLTSNNARDYTLLLFGQLNVTSVVEAKLQVNTQAGASIITSPYTDAVNEAFVKYLSNPTTPQVVFASNVMYDTGDPGTTRSILTDLLASVQRVIDTDLGVYFVGVLPEGAHMDPAIVRRFVQVVTLH